MAGQIWPRGLELDTCAVEGAGQNKEDNLGGRQRKCCGCVSTEEQRKATEPSRNAEVIQLLITFAVQLLHSPPGWVTKILQENMSAAAVSVALRRDLGFGVWM